MFGNESSYEDDTGYAQRDETESLKFLAPIITVCIPKVEPCFRSNSNEDLSNIDEFTESPIPFTAPYKLKDPIVLLERCDKIWETLQLIKNVQNRNEDESTDDQTTETVSTPQKNTAVPSYLRESEPAYIKYSPILGNIDRAIPSFKLSVKTTKKLYHCVTCGKQYAENRSLRIHSNNVHGIYIPPKRKFGRPDNKDVQHNEKEQNTEVNDPVPSRVEHRNPDIESPPHKRRRLNSTQDNAVSTDSDVTKNNPKPNSNTEELQQETTNVTQQVLSKTKPSYNTVKCILCSRSVRYLKHHFIHYHKIACSVRILRELGQTIRPDDQDFQESESSGSEKAELPSDKPAQEDCNISEPISTQPESDDLTNDKAIVNETCQTDVSCVEPKKKVTFNDNKVSPARDEAVPSATSQPTQNKVHQCDICFGVYSSYNGLWKHRRTHRMRGETKENFHKVKCRYTRSPFCVKDKPAVTDANSPTTSSSLPDNRHINDDTCADLMLVNRTALDTLDNSDVDNISDGDRREHTDTVCTCGRVFRNPHTLYMHKSNCKLQKSDEDENITDDKTDRDSGAGFHITIKKRNDSYEIVGRDSDEDGANTSDHPADKDALPGVPDHILEDCSNIQTNDKQFEALESSKYSKHHSILKLEIVDEDVDVDIEEDSQVSINDKVAQDKVGSKTENKLSAAEESESKENDQKLIHNEVPTLKSLCKKVLATNKQQKKRNPMKRTVVKSNTICMCGKSLPNQNLLKAHMSQAHPLYLTCGYCKLNLKTAKMYNDHKCTIKEGKAFVGPNVDLHCPYCNVALNSYTAFDDHISLKHPDPTAPFHCYTCTERFTTVSFRMYHFKLKHGNTFCSVCYKKMTLSVKIKHEGYHLGQGYPCHLCKKAFLNKDFQKKHARVVHNNLNDTLLACPVCSKVFKKRSFQWHLYAHFNGEETCRVCGEVVRNAKVLDYHATVLHHGIYPKLKCSSCDACFISVRALEKHQAYDMCYKVSEKSEPKNALRES